MKMAIFDGARMASVVVDTKGPTPGATTTEPPALKQNAKRPLDSGYGSQKSSPSEKNECYDKKPPSSPAALPFLLASGRKSRLHVFKRDLDYRANERWDIIKTQIDGLLRDYLKSRKKLHFRSSRSQPVPVTSFRLMLLGEREADAKEYMVVLCSERVARTVRKFFDKEQIVRELCEPPDEAYPRLSVAVYPQQLKLTSQRNIEVFGATTEIPEHTLCGQPIHFIDEENHIKQGTIGGTVKVVDNNGAVHLYALTAGHCLLDWVVDDENSDDSSAADTSDRGYSDEEFLKDEEACSKKKKVDPSIRKEADFLGQVSQVSLDGLDGYLDWALLEINKNLPNLLFELDQRGNVLKKSISAEEDVEIPTGTCSLEATPTSREVIMVERSHRSRHGLLSPMVGRIMIGPGDSFTDTYILSLKDGFVSDGSSGTWVVDSRTLRVIGHVVATDMCGDVYVLPMRAILDDIQRQLGAVHVSLASDVDVSIAATKNELSISTNNLPKHTSVDPACMSRIMEDEFRMSSSADDLTTTAVDHVMKRGGPPSSAESQRGKANIDPFTNQWLGSLSSNSSQTLKIPSHAATNGEALTAHSQSKTPLSGHSSTSQPSNNSTPESTWGFGLSQRQNKRKLYDSISDCERELSSADKKLKTSPARSTVGLKASLACPFATRFPSTCENCSRYSLARIQDVERHLYQHHRAPVGRSGCLRCTGSLGEERGQDTSVSCARCATHEASFMSPHQEARVQGIKARWEDKKFSLEEQWFDLYETLFPQALKPPSLWRLVDAEELDESALGNSSTNPESLKLQSSNALPVLLEGSQSSKQEKIQDTLEEELSPELSTTSGVLVVGGFAFKASMALLSIIRSLQSQNKDARALKTEVSDLSGVLGSALEIISSNPNLDFKALELPLHRCGSTCEEYAKAISQYTANPDRSRSATHDWTTQKYRQGDINDLRFTLATYKSIINIALADANLSTTTISPGVVEEYKDLISDTMVDLSIYLEALREKITRLQSGYATATDDLVVEWNWEKQNAQQGLKMCSQLSTEIARFEFASTENMQFSNQPSTHKHSKSGFEKTSGSTQGFIARLKAQEASINAQIEAAALDQEHPETDVTHLALLRQTKESISECIQVISETNDMDERANVFEDITLSDNSYAFSVSTVSDIVKARRLNLEGRSRHVGGQVTDGTIQRSIEALTELDAEHIRSQSTKGGSSQEVQDPDSSKPSNAPRDFRSFNDRFGPGISFSSRKPG